jgi:hypothetical protein
VLLELRFEALAPGRCTARAGRGLPLRERVRPSPFAVAAVDAADAGERAEPLDGGDVVEFRSTKEGVRAWPDPAGGFFVTADIVDRVSDIGYRVASKRGLYEELGN